MLVECRAPKAQGGGGQGEVSKLLQLRDLCYQSKPQPASSVDALPITNKVFNAPLFYYITVRPACASDWLRRE